MPGLAGADLPTFSPAKASGKRPRRLGASGLVQSRLGKRLRYLLFGSPRPQMQGSRLPPPGEESPGHRSRRHPPSFPPSLHLALPPSLPPSRAAARGALPRATCSGPNPGISEKEKRKDLLYENEKKGRPLTAFIFHALTIGRPQFRRPGHSPEAAEVCGACCLAHTDHRAPRTARCTPSGPPPPAAQTRNRPQGPSYRLNIRLPASRLTTALEPTLLVCGQSPYTIHLVGALAPYPDTLSSQVASWATLGLRRCPGLQTSSPEWDPHKAPRAGVPTRSPSLRFPPPPSPVPKKSFLHLQASRGKADGRGEVSGRPQRSVRLSGAPAAGEISERPRLSLASSCLFRLLPQVSNTHTRRVQLYKSCSSFSYHN